MFAVLIAIAAGIILFGGIGNWVYHNIDVLSSWVDYVKSAFDAFTDIIPLWLLPFVGIALALGILGIVVKLL